MLTLPKPVKIGPHRWNYKRMTKKPPKGVGSDYVYSEQDGYCHTTMRIIWIHPDVMKHRTKLCEIVVHETIHAINDTYGITDKSSEEHFTNQMGMGLTQLFAHNARFLRYVEALLRPKKIKPLPPPESVGVKV